MENKPQDELVEVEGIKIKRSQIDLVKRTVFIGATDDELRMFFYECARRGTHPLDRLIFPVVRKDKDGNRRVAFQTGIDYLRAAAEETGRYVGQKAVEYGPMISQNIEGGTIDAPEWAEAIVIRKDPESGEAVEVSSKAFWKEYYPGEKLGHMWRKMPHLMLGKCAEAAALRKGFPRKLGGLYINEELEQASTLPFTPIEMPKTKTESPPKTDKAHELITDAQRKRFYVIAKKNQATDDQIKEWLYREYNFEHIKDIPKDMYDEICSHVEVELADSNAQ